MHSNIALSEVSSQTLIRANNVHPIAALQSEFSIWTRDVEKEILPTCQTLGIAMVPYSPLGRGFLTGKIQSVEGLDASDFRRKSPRFQEENLHKNLQLITMMEELAKQLNISTTQLALACLLAKDDQIVPIPGTKRKEYLDENIGAVDIHLPEEIKNKLDEIAPIGIAAGERYHEAGISLIDN
ncbi:aldo/keto reductase [Niallia sp. 03133]|uniref:aldo/keto reductase n=1 Tax=Niallia sp. 03133 TaxID=3458060 RepID=UPI004044405F